MKQLKFKGIPKALSEFGGSLLVNKRKDKRPLSFKSPQHVVFKSETVDKTTSFVKYKSGIQKIISKTAKKFGVKIYNTSINFNHIHNALLFSSREQYNTFEADGVDVWGRYERKIPINQSANRLKKE